MHKRPPLCAAAGRESGDRLRSDDLRRLRHHGLIERISNSHRYRVTFTGPSTAMIISAVHDLLLPAGLADVETSVPTRLRAATRSYQSAIDNLTHITGLAASTRI